MNNANTIASTNLATLANSPAVLGADVTAWVPPSKRAAEMIASLLHVT